MDARARIGAHRGSVGRRARDGPGSGAGRAARPSRAGPRRAAADRPWAGTRTRPKTGCACSAVCVSRSRPRRMATSAAKTEAASPAAAMMCRFRARSCPPPAGRTGRSAAGAPAAAVVAAPYIRSSATSVSVEAGISPRVMARRSMIRCWARMGSTTRARQAAASSGSSWAAAISPERIRPAGVRVTTLTHARSAVSRSPRSVPVSGSGWAAVKSAMNASRASAPRDRHRR